MLVVPRCPGESAVIELPTGERIEVVVLVVKGDQVRLGTNAPPEVLVLREKLLKSAASED